jgi:carboxyl-terminal processing protease
MIKNRRAALVVGGLAFLLAVSLCLAAALPGRSDAFRYLFVYNEVWNLTRANYVEPVDESELLQGAYRGMLSSLDAASAYLPEGSDLDVLTPAGPGRTGLELLPSGGVAVVVRVEDASPAHEAGIRVGDQVWSARGTATRQLSWPELRRLLTGEVGEEIPVSVLDGRTFRLRDLTLTLAEPADGGFAVHDEGEGVARLRIHDFSRIDPAKLAAAVDEALGATPGKALLVDLRGVVGLDVDDLARVAGAVFGPGPILHLVAKDGPARTIEASASEASIEHAPIFVLVDGSTAGTGEALAALLSEKSEAVLCGRETYGLAGLPELIPLSEGGHVLLTTQEMRTRGGVSWSDDGLEPDHALTVRFRRSADDDDRSDPLLDAALEWIREGAVVEVPEPVRPAASFRPGVPGPSDNSALGRG